MRRPPGRRIAISAEIEARAFFFDEANELLGEVRLRLPALSAVIAGWTTLRHTGVLDRVAGTVAMDPMAFSVKITAGALVLASARPDSPIEAADSFPSSARRCNLQRTALRAY